MSNQSLANKYRSKNFDDLIGQDHISHILKYQAAHHTRQANYLFFWPRGTGKTSSARLFAKALNCLITSDGNPCNTCENCLAINNGTTMDIMEIDAASHTGVDNIREEIIDKLMYRPSQLKKRITIIDEVHMLSKGAFNALLKTMEEPTDWMVFILATTELTKVPETIISRCQVFNFKKIPFWQIVERLSYIAQQESISSTPEWLGMIASLSDGCMRDAVKYLDQISVMGEVTPEQVSQFLWVVSEQMIANILDTMRAYQSSGSDSDFTTLINQITNLSNQWVDLTLFPKQLMQYADQHFSEDANFYSEVSKLASTLLAQSKRYPHPLLLYKTILYSNKQQVEPQQQTVKIAGKRSETEKIPSSSNKEQSEERNNWYSEAKGEIPVDNNFSPIKELDVSLPSAWESQTNSNSDAKSPDFISFLSPSLQKLLQWQSDLTQVQDGIAQLIILNPLAKIALQKKENQDLICDAIRTATGQTIINLDLSFMTKDEYFAHNMGI